MKISTITILMLVAGALLVLAGAIFKIMHWSYANGILMGGMLVELVAVGMVIYQLRKPKS